MFMRFVFCFRLYIQVRMQIVPPYFEYYEIVE